LEDANTNYIKYLIELSQKGRKNSFIELCNFNLLNVYALSLRIVASKALAKEMTKVIFSAAWENIVHFREEIPFPDWLKAISVYTILEEIRSKKIFSELNVDVAEDRPESKYLLDQMIFNLPEKERIIFVLHELEGYSPQEISDFLGDMSKTSVVEVLKSVRSTFIEELNR